MGSLLLYYSIKLGIWDIFESITKKERRELFFFSEKVIIVLSVKKVILVIPYWSVITSDTILFIVANMLIKRHFLNSHSKKGHLCKEWLTNRVIKLFLNEKIIK